MFFFPYRLDIALIRIPFLTLLVCLICAGTFLHQLKSAGTFGQNLDAYCANEIDANLRAILAAIDDREAGRGCAPIFLTLRQAHDREQEIAALAREVRGLEFYADPDADIRYKTEALRSGYANFDLLVPKSATEKLEYQPDRYNPVTMITSTFAHANWDHLLGNLLFFFIFASCVECALGPLSFVGTFLAFAVGTSLAYSFHVRAAEAIPSIGLSGVAMGMMAMLTTMLPRARVWCFLWFLLFFRRFRLPVLVIAAWYIGWNVYDLAHPDPTSHVDYMAHVSGAALGIATGSVVRLFAPQRLAQLEQESG